MNDAILELLELSERMRSRLVLRSCISNHEWSRIADEIEGIAQSMVMPADYEVTKGGGMTDRNVEAVREKLLARSRVGVRKYGTTTERGDIDFVGWLTHLQEELMDAAVYIEAIIAPIPYELPEKRQEGK